MFDLDNKRGKDFFENILRGRSNGRGFQWEEKYGTQAVFLEWIVDVEEVVSIKILMLLIILF